MTDNTAGLTSLQRQKQQLTVEALIDAAQRGMMEHGLDVTVDDIAVLAGVARRTVFRHFATREDLLDAALAAAVAEFIRSLPEYGGGDWLAWLTDLARVSHERSASWGRLMWEVKTRRLPPRLAKYADAPHRVSATTSATIWKAAGGAGPPPKPLRQAVAAHLSPLFTQTVLLDADGTPKLAAEMATNAIVATLRQLTDE